jgi:type II secretory pathway component PulF
MRLAYRAWDNAGRLIADVIDAADFTEARETLRRQGLHVTDLSESNGKSPSLAPSRKRSVGRGARLKQLSAFCKQLFILIKTGTPIVQALEAAERQTRDAAFKQVVTDVRTKVEEGTPLSEAMGTHPEYFDIVSRSLVQAGESAGKLPMMLERIGALARKQVQVRGSIVGSMIYPSLLITVALSVLMLMMTFVLPRFAGLFEQLDTPLPPTTAFLMDISYVLRNYWWAVLGGCVAVVGGFVMWQKTPGGKAVRDTALLRLPIVGPIMRNFATAKIARLMGILLDSYLPLLDVLGLVKQASNNMHYEAMLARAEKAVIHGEPMSSAFSDEKLINSSVYEALRNGEASGQIAPLMLTVADFMDEDNETVVRSLTSILEPVILILLGLVIGFVAISMFLPLFDLTASAGKH